VHFDSSRNKKPISVKRGDFSEFWREIFSAEKFLFVLRRRHASKSLRHHPTRVVFFVVVDQFLGIDILPSVGILPHALEWQRPDGLAVCGVQVAVLDPAVPQRRRLQANRPRGNAY